MVTAAMKLKDPCAFPVGAAGLRGAWPSPLPTMACAHPLISEYSEKGESSGKNVTLPAVFKAPIWPDIVNFVNTNLGKNNRQPYAVSELAGHQTSAESWGTGRAVARIPRVRGGGLTVLVRVLLETCVVGAACLHQPRPGDVGTAE